MMEPITAISPDPNKVERVIWKLHGRICVRTDKLIALLMALQWPGAIIAAFLVSAKTWNGAQSSIHPHVLIAIYLGGLITVLPVVLAFLYPGKRFTRHAIAACQMLMSGLLIHVSGGRIETHFHVFGSLAFLAFYLDWQVLLTATLVTPGRPPCHGLLRSRRHLWNHDRRQRAAHRTHPVGRLLRLLSHHLLPAKPEGAP